MITFNELLERAENEDIAIHTSNEEQAKTLLKALDEKKFRWNSGEKLTDRTYYEFDRENTCYTFNLNKRVSYCSLVWYQYKGYTIIEFKDIDFKENA